MDEQPSYKIRSFLQQQQEARAGGPRETVRGGAGTEFGGGVAARPRRARRADIVFAPGAGGRVPEATAAFIRARMGRTAAGRAAPGAAARRARAAATAAGRRPRLAR